MSLNFGFNLPWRWPDWARFRSAMIVLFLVWCLCYGFYWYSLWRFSLYPDSLWWEGQTGTWENNQSEVAQIMLAAWVFKHFVYVGSPESKDPSEVKEGS